MNSHIVKLVRWLHTHDDYLRLHLIEETRSWLRNKSTEKNPGSSWDSNPHAKSSSRKLEVGKLLIIYALYA